MSSLWTDWFFSHPVPIATTTATRKARRTRLKDMVSSRVSHQPCRVTRRHTCCVTRDAMYTASTNGARTAKYEPLLCGRTTSHADLDRLAEPTALMQ